MGELFADIHRLNLANQNLGILRYFNACQLGNGCRFLTHNLGIQAPFTMMVLRTLSISPCFKK